MKKNKAKIKLLISLIIIVFLFIAFSQLKSYLQKPPVVIETEPVQEIKTEPYIGKIYHIFFHSLIVYPKLAFSDKAPDHQGYRDYMVTRSEFYKILDQLYERNFILINDRSLYSENSDGTISKKILNLPVGKKPLIISLDDLNYYENQTGNGFANKFVLNEKGEVATVITTPEGETDVTQDGDVVPILNDYIKKHPDFSWHGAKGIIALTGFEGILGYRTNNVNSPTYIEDTQKVKTIVRELKATGWVFASHSYSHQRPFRDDSISLDGLKKDTELWDREVRPLVGNTNIFVGPFGQVFKPYDERRNYLVSKGFKVLYGVGMDQFLGYYPDYIMMDRANIDGIRLTENSPYLIDLFNTKEVIDIERF